MADKKLLLLSILALSVYDLYRREQPAPVFYVSSLPGGFNALTLPPVGIFVVNAEKQNDMLLLHELVHWRQYVDQGTLLYYINYLTEYLIYGYDAMPMEIEARYLEPESVRYNYTEAVRTGQALTVSNKMFRI